MNHREVEERLRRLPRPNAPEGLRRRVLGAAGAAAIDDAWSRAGHDREPGAAAFALTWTAVLAAGIALHAVATGGASEGAGLVGDEATTTVRDSRPVQPVGMVEGFAPEDLVREDDPRFGDTDLVVAHRGVEMEILR